MQTIRIPTRLVRDGLLHLPSALGGFEMVLPVGILSDIGAAELVAAELSGGWEAEERRWLRATLTPEHTFVDVGAHFGIMALEAAALGIRTVAIEPHPDNLRTLSACIAHNGVGPMVRVVAAAATRTPGPVWLRTNTSMGHTLSSEVPDASERAAQWSEGPLAGQPVWLVADGLSLAEILAGEPGGLVLKLDVEGHEFDVLKGAEPLLAAGRISHVLWERGDGENRKPDHADIEDYLSAYGLKTRTLTPLNALSELETA
ncbi:MAG: FkbM family methyltransferase [Thalassobaculum sp.]